MYECLGYVVFNVLKCNEFYKEKYALEGVRKKGRKRCHVSHHIINNPSTSEPETLKVLAKVILQNQSNDEIISDDEARRRREQLNRRPSYRYSIYSFGRLLSTLQIRSSNL
uniref:KID domain-containing protein n=1 Tax=Wuchereria bancrofti TaxID=6293 RepID=A0AAF5Q400_WUCBA